MEGILEGRREGTMVRGARERGVDARMEGRGEGRTEEGSEGIIIQQSQCVSLRLISVRQMNKILSTKRKGTL